MLTSTNIN